MSLKQKTETLRTQLGLRPDLSMSDVIKEALTQLGLEGEAGCMNMIDKADLCLSRIGVADAAVPMGIAVPDTPVVVAATVVPVQPIQPVAAAVEMVRAGPMSTTSRLRLALRDGRGLALEHSDVDATHGRRAFHIRMATAAEAIEVEFRVGGNVAVVAGHHTLGFCLDNWYGRNDVGNRQHFSTWYRSHSAVGALRFQFNQDDGTISPIEAPHLVLGWEGHSQLVRRGDGRQMQFVVPGNTTIMADAAVGYVGTGAAGLIQTKDIEGCWICCCFPFFWWAVFKKEAQGPDALKHAGCLMSPLLCPFEEHRQRHPGTNGFFKIGEPGNVDLYSSSSFACNGLSCTMKLC